MSADSQPTATPWWPAANKCFSISTRFPMAPFGEWVAHSNSVPTASCIFPSATSNHRQRAKLDNPYGKILRINSDGSIPTDNPFYNTTTGINRAIWAYGLRNPYTTAFQPGTGKFYIDDVGNSLWEEIDEGAPERTTAGAPPKDTFNQSQFPNFTEPLYAYAHNGGTLVAITGGTFYDPTFASFRASTRETTSSTILAPAKFASLTLQPRK